MASVDDRIVAMKFDNATFERKLSETLSSLDKLRASLDFASSRHGLENLSAASKNFSMAPMGAAVDGISTKFLALATIGITALSNITNRAVDSGIRMAKAFTMGPITEGFREWETNMNSIQTILANTDSKGSTLEDVNAALQELNEYSDKTIYNFSQMARNIGTFTAAGVDLDVATGAIKGIANLAAISGSNSEQASTAMYQLSQAMATGTVKLMDWNSVVNAGMGGEVFQKALFETGKQMKTIAGVGMDTSFEEWTAAGNSFRGSLEQGWLTGEVLTNTLKGFTGDLTEAQILSMGYTQEQATEIMRLGALGKAAATEVKTFTQLISTVKESLASGWSSSIRIIVGDFEEAKTLFSGISNAIGGMVQDSAEGRNALLQGWKDFGGRTALIDHFQTALHGVASILMPIANGFRDIFPPMTVQRLLEMTESFGRFAASIKIGGETAAKIRSIFAGFFAVFSIGWNIIKEFVGLIGDLISELAPVGDGVLGFAAETGDTLVALQKGLVAGGGIKAFFENLGEIIRKPIEFLKDFKQNVIDFFASFTGSDAAAEAVSRVGDRFEFLGRIADRLGDIWSMLSEKFEGVHKVLDEVFGFISEWFSELGEKLALAMDTGDFDAIVDLINVGLLGGIGVILKKFLDNGISLDFGGGLMNKISETFGTLTDTMKAMQTEIKAEALLKIAGAIAILTASVLVLSLIDSAALTKALVALSVGFGQLIGALTLLDQISTTASAVKLTILAGGMILLSVAVGILSLAIKNLSTLGWEELAKGLIGVTVSIVALSASTQLIAANTSGMFRAGLAMIGISVALLILSKAVKEFSEMGWAELAKGLLGISVGLLALTLAVNAMPPGMAAMGVGLILLSGGLLILSQAVQSFATISWGEMAKGFVGIGVGLGIVAGAMHLMPPGMPLMAAGILILSVALNVMAKAVESMGDIPFGEMAKSLGAFAVMLGILSAAMLLMTGTAAGAASLLLVSGALLVLTQVLKEVARLKLSEIAIGLGTIAAVLAVLGIAAIALSGALPAMIGLGIALTVLGVGFAAFGLAAMLVAKAIEVIARVGKTGMAVFLEMLEIGAKAIPTLIGALVSGTLEALGEILNAIPTLIEGLKVILGHIIDTVIELAPKVGEAFGAIISSAMDVVMKQAPKLIDTGMKLIVAFMSGISRNIGMIVTLAVEIITNFANALSMNVQLLVDSAILVVFSFLNAISTRMGDIVTAGVTLLLNFLLGISQSVGLILAVATHIIVSFIQGITNSIGLIISAGTNMLVQLLLGISNTISTIVSTVAQIIVAFVNALSDNARKVIDAGVDILVKFITGITDNLIKITNAVGSMITTFIDAVTNNLQKVITAGTNLIVSLVTGIGNNANKVVTAGADAIIKFVEGLGQNSLKITNAASSVIIDFMNGLASTIRQKSGEFREAGLNIASAIISGLTGGLSDKAGAVVNKITDIAGGAVNAAKSFLGIGSPSKVFAEIGRNLMRGLEIGIHKNESLATSSIADVAHTITSRLEDALNKISSIPMEIDASPVITPVLDLTKVRAGAMGLDQLMNVSTIRPEVSFDRARLISTTTDLQDDGNDVSAPVEPSEMKFEQNIYSPTALSANDIYRATKSQIALAKEELEIT